MAINISVNGESIDYPQAGDPGWADNATNFAIQTSSALGQLGLDTGTTVDLPGTLDVTGNTTLDANLFVAGNATITGNLTANGNSNLGNASGDTIAVTGILNVDSGVLYVDPTNNRVGINNTTPSQALDVTGNVAITGNETVGGALNVAGATSLSSTLGVTGDVAINTNKFNVTASNGNTTIGGVTYLDDDTTANTPVLSFTGDTNTGIGRSGADTLDFITNGASRFRIESTGQIKAVYESTIGTDYNTQLDNGYLCRAWVNFNGTATQRTGTYTISGTTITVNITSHGLSTGNFAQLDFASGDGVDGRYQVTVINANSYTVTNPVSGSTGGNVTQDAMIRASGNVSSITDNNTGDYTVNFTTAMPDVNYSTTVTGYRANTANSILAAVISKSATYGDIIKVGSVRVGTFFPFVPGVANEVATDAEGVFVAVFR